MTTAAALAATTKLSWGSAVAAGGHVISISCASAGNCAAGGYDNDGAFVVDETGGAWGTAIEVPGTVGGQVDSVSCASAGNCAAGGYDNDGAFVADETGGVWGTAIDVPGTAGGSRVNSVSCASAGNCAAGGVDALVPNARAFVASETNGVWGKAITSAAFGAEVNSISCVSLGNCLAGGSLLLREKNGVWGKAKIRTGYITSISCVNAANCAAGGPGWVMSETRGVWRKPVSTPGDVYSVSCGSPGTCAAVGDRDAGRGSYYGFLMSSKRGVWGQRRRAVMSGESFMGAVSCAGAGSCAATGGYYLNGPWAFVVAEKNWVWGQAQDVPGLTALDPGPDQGFWGTSISCVKAGRCAIGGAGGFVTAP